MDLLIVLLLSAILGGAGYAIHRSKKSGRNASAAPPAAAAPAAPAAAESKSRRPRIDFAVGPGAFCVIFQTRLEWMKHV